MKQNHPFQDEKNTKIKDKLAYCHWSWILIGRTKSKPFAFRRLRIFCCFQLVKYDRSWFKRVQWCHQNKRIQQDSRPKHFRDPYSKLILCYFFYSSKSGKVKSMPLTPHWRTHITKLITKSQLCATEYSWITRSWSESWGMKGPISFVLWQVEEL